MARSQAAVCLVIGWIAWGCCALGSAWLQAAQVPQAPDSTGSQTVFVSQTTEDFQRWAVWDTRPDRPGLVRRLDGPSYSGKPSCTLEDQSVSHDPRLASPVFEIPEDRWLTMVVAACSDRPQHFFTITLQYLQREGNREIASVELPFTVAASYNWGTMRILAPPASVVKPKSPKTGRPADAAGPSFRYARLMVYPVLRGQYFGQCHAWHLRAGTVHLGLIRVDAMPAGFTPPAENRQRWFEFSTQLLPKQGKPAASFDFLHERPAGKRGTVRLHPDGYLVFADGSPVRLWGVAWHEYYFHTQHGKSPQVWKDEHQRAVNTLAALGCNFVRWHGLGRGLWDNKTGQFHQKRWEEVVDPALAMLSEQGFYHQLTLWFFSDLLMPRQWLPPEIRDDESWHRAYPTYNDYHRQKWAIFCFQPMLHRMLQLQEQIMRHENPHRKMRYADDPSIVVVQPINEVSLCARSPTDTPLWDPTPPPGGRRSVLPEGVEKAFQAEWNRWLMGRFGSREKLLALYPRLAEEWQAMGVGDADPAKGNVPLPPLPWRLDAKAKRSDGWWHRVYLDFVIDRERQFYRDFAQSMRKLGYRNALAGDAGGEWRQQLATHADLDVPYDLHHPYTDHGDSHEDFCFALNHPLPLQTPELIYECQAVHQWGKAAVISEWGAGTINQYRAMLPILVAVDSAMQQRSAIAEHTFGYPFMRPDHFLGVSAGFGNLIGDPGRIATYPAAAVLFCIPEAIHPPRRFAVQLFTDEDLATPVSGLQGSENAGQFFGVSYLVHMMRVRWARWDGQTGQVPPADLLYFPITSGVGNLKALPADKKLFLVVPPEITHSGWEIVKPYERLLSLYPNVRFQKGRYRLRVKLANGFEAHRQAEGRFFVLASLPAGTTPIGADEQKQVCWAFYDQRSLVVSDPAVLQDFIPAALDAALKHWGLAPAHAGLVGPWELLSSTGQVRRNWKAGWIVVDSDYAQALMGDLSRVRAGRFLSVVGKPQVGVLALVPLEKKPLSQAKQWFLTAVGRVANRDYHAVYSAQTEPYRLSGVRLQIGKGPAVCEPLRATAVLQGLKLDKARVTALNPDLSPKKQVPATVVKGELRIPLEDAETIWLLIEAM